MRTKVIMVVTFVLLAAGPRALGSIIVSYDFAGDVAEVEGRRGLKNEQTARGHRPTGLQLGTQFSGSGVALSSLKLVPGGSPRIADAAPVENSYLSLTVKAGTGFRFDLAGLEFEAPDTHAPEYLVQTSVSGFGPAAPMFLPRKIVRTGSGSARIRVDLSGGGLRELEQIEFRIYAPATDAGGLLTIDDLQLNGTVVKAPEPSSFLIWSLLLPLGVGLAAVLSVLRWRSLRCAPAVAGSVQGIAYSDREMSRPCHRWPKHVRTAVLDIIDRGRSR